MRQLLLEFNDTTVGGVRVVLRGADQLDEVVIETLGRDGLDEPKWDKALTLKWGGSKAGDEWTRREEALLFAVFKQLKEAKP